LKIYQTIFALGVILVTSTVAHAQNFATQPTVMNTVAAPSAIPAATIVYRYRTVVRNRTFMHRTFVSVPYTDPALAARVNLALATAKQAKASADAAAGKATLANDNASNALVGVWQAKVRANQALANSQVINGRVNAQDARIDGISRAGVANAASEGSDRILIWLIPIILIILVGIALMAMSQRLAKKDSSFDEVDVRDYAGKAFNEAERARGYANDAKASAAEAGTYAKSANDLVGNIERVGNQVAKVAIQVADDAKSAAGHRAAVEEYSGDVLRRTQSLDELSARLNRLLS
jgi:hypothetical protein